MKLFANQISNKAVVDTDQIGRGVVIGPFAVVSENVILGDYVVIHPHVVLQPGVRIGNGVEIFPFSYIGKAPKGAGNLAKRLEYREFVEIGDHCSIGPGAVIYYDVSIGANTLIGDSASIREQVIIDSRCIIGRFVSIFPVVSI
jgi:UDP-3-O-[3-hydroxymyristoyl] glucosamine N-acyltransferase